MSARDDRLPMLQMLEHAREALDMIRGQSRADLATNRTLQLALVYLVQTVGEAATRVSREGQSRHPDVPWGQATTTRHRMVHGYDRIDYGIVWDTIADDFPPLVQALERALASETR